jgi:hypothetical protein
MIEMALSQPHTLLGTFVSVIARVGFGYLLGQLVFYILNFRGRKRQAERREALKSLLETLTEEEREQLRKVYPDYPGLRKIEEDSKGLDLTSFATSKARERRIDPDRVFSWVGRIFSRRIRMRLYTPYVDELREDFLESRGKLRTTAARKWLLFCLSVKFAVLLCFCFKQLAGEVAVSQLRKLIGPGTSDFLKQFLRKIRG